MERKNAHGLATVADKKTAASWEKGRKTAKTQFESAFGWVLIGRVLGRSLNKTKRSAPKTPEIDQNGGCHSSNPEDVFSTN